MMLFRLKIDATFEAEGIDDAFRRVALHFLALGVDPDYESMLQILYAPTEMEIGPVDEP